MKMIIKTNGKFKNAKLVPENEKNNETYSIEFEFDKVYVWSDLEFWLQDENGEYCDHLCMNVSKRNKIKTQK